MKAATPSDEVRIPVPQRYKDFVVQRQYRWLWYIMVGVIGGVNAVYYLLCIVFQWKWQFYFQGDMLLPLVGLISYTIEVKRPWQYVVDDRLIKLFVISPKFQVARLEELAWAKTEIIGVQCDEWQGLPCLKLQVLPETGCDYVLVYGLSEAEEVKTRILPLIEKYRRQYRQELWADKLRS